MVLKRKCKLLLFFFAFFCGNQNVKAQDAKLPPLNFAINAGYGFPNIVGRTIASQGTGYNGATYNTVFFEAGCELSKRILLSFYFSEADGSTGNFTWLDTLKVTHTNYFTSSIVTVGLSFKYYLGHGPHFKPYVGGMVGYCFVNLDAFGDFEAQSSDGPNPNLGGFAYHAYIGSHYFIKWWGLDARIGYGNNYYASIGFVYKFQVSREED